MRVLLHLIQDVYVTNILNGFMNIPGGGFDASVSKQNLDLSKNMNILEIFHYLMSLFLLYVWVAKACLN